MKTRLGAFLLVGLSVLMLAWGCNGANDVVGPGDPILTETPVTPIVTPKPRPTPEPCRFDPTLCD